MGWRPWILVGLVAVASAEARFAATQGFSGKHGVSCGACHNPPPYGDDPVLVDWTGFPEAWDPEASYTFQLRITGGPRANPLPNAPQAGFDLESDGGTFEPGPGMADLLRTPSAQEITYTGAGTLRREWSVTWHAPNLSAPPQPVRFWIAALAANGNHVMGGPEVAGELGDRFVANLRTLPPSPAARDAWAAQALQPPLLDPVAPLRPWTPFTVRGTTPMGADGAQWRLDESPWRPALGAPAFFFQVEGLGPGTYRLEARTVLDDRASEPASTNLTVGDASGPAASRREGSDAVAPWTALLLPAVAALLLAPLALRLRRR